MLGRPVFDVVIGAYALMGAGLARHLWHVATRPWTWQRPVRAPKLSQTYPTLSSGVDYVGWV